MIFRGNEDLLEGGCEGMLKRGVTQTQVSDVQKPIYDQLSGIASIPGCMSESTSTQVFAR